MKLKISLSAQSHLMNGIRYNFAIYIDNTILTPFKKPARYYHMKEYMVPYEYK